MGKVHPENKISESILLKNQKDHKVKVLISTKMGSKPIKKIKIKIEKHQNINVVKDQHPIGNRISMSRILKALQLKKTKEIKDRDLTRRL